MTNGKDIYLINHVLPFDFMGMKGDFQKGMGMKCVPAM